MSLPYLGSKEKISHKIYRAIAQREPQGQILIDLFCGGLAITEIFLKKGWQCIANDKNKYTIALLKKAIKGYFNDKRFSPDFITKEKYYYITKFPEKHEDWFVGYLQCIWSFGNNQKNYLFGRDKEKYKEAGHHLVVNKNPAKILKLFPKIPGQYIKGIMGLDNWHKRRIALRKVSVKLKTRIYELEQLQQIERLQQLQRLQLKSKDYRDVFIPRNAIVYCDPPYKGRAEYAEKGFNHSEFWNYMRVLSQKNKVYISEYEAPDDFDYIVSFSKGSTLSSGTKNSPNEKVFIYKKPF